MNGARRTVAPAKNRRPDSVAIEWTSKTVYVLEFKRTSDQRQDYRERGEGRARVQHDVLVKSLDTVAKEAEGENAGWTVKLIRSLGWSNRNETQSGEDSYMSC